MPNKAKNIHHTDLDTVNLQSYINKCQDSSYEHLHSLMLSEQEQESGGQVIGENKEISQVEGEISDDNSLPPLVIDEDRETGDADNVDNIDDNRLRM